MHQPLVSAQPLQGAPGKCKQYTCWPLNAPAPDACSSKVGLDSATYIQRNEVPVPVMQDSVRGVKGKYQEA